MIGKGLVKLAKEQGMTVSSGVAYGAFKGYAVTLSEGAGWKRMDIVTGFPDDEKKRAFAGAVDGVDITKSYRVQQLELAQNRISVTFLDNPGTMKKIAAFNEWFFPLLDQCEARKVNTCAECGGETSGSWYLIDGIAYPMHESCARHLQETMDSEAQQRSEEDTGSYGLGALGAFLGAVLGAALWAVVLYLGYLAAVVGFVIGWLAEKGYNLFRGKQGKGKLAILILAVIFGVLLGTLLPDAVTLAGMIANGELPGYGYGDIPGMILLVFLEDAEYMRVVLSNGGMGLLFAAMGVFGLLAKTKRETSVPKMKKLN